MKHFHLVGIGGAGLSAIARVLLESGQLVSGSDEQETEFTARLRASGVRIFIGHAAQNIAGAELVLVSSAVASANPEVVAAVQAGLPVVKRHDFVGGMMAERVGLAIAGTHGKTTTAALTAYLLSRAGQQPSFIVGGLISDLDTNARHGTGLPFVVEADEYDRMFLGLRPTVAVVTNVEHDHPDCYPTFAEMQAAFDEFAALVPAQGVLIVCNDDAGARALAQSARKRGTRVVTYGLQTGADWRAELLQPNSAGGCDFLVSHAGRELGLARTRLAGDHNVCNALAALAAVDYCGVPFATALPALRAFRGVGRRFEVKGEVHGITVVDDYAHHPTEIRATLASARQRFPGRPLWAMFQPHTYSRTRALMANFASSFGDADHVVVSDIYSAREASDAALSSADLIGAMQHADAQYVGGLEAAAHSLAQRMRPGDVLLTLGAGTSHKVGELVLAELRHAMVDAE
ncbi:MAG: UDP-N-acetylmuramate--L-alanine ligase [Chloroflexota bacterium]